MEDEIDGAQSGIYLSRRHGGPLPFQPKKAIPELETALEALLEKGETASGLARKLGVSYRTLCRWRFAGILPRRSRKAMAASGATPLNKKKLPKPVDRQLPLLDV